MRSLAVLLSISLGLVPSLACSYLTGVAQLLKTDDQLAAEYGYITLSRPVSMPLREVVSLLETNVPTVDFATALQEVSKFQSLGMRETQELYQLQMRASADLQKLQGLLASNGLPQTPATEAPAAPPALPTVTPPTATSPIAGPFATTALSTRFSDRTQAAYHSILLSRLTSSQLAVWKLREQDWEIRAVFTTLTLVPGEKTRFDSAAELRVLFNLEGLGSKYLRVVPLFPTYDSVAELNEASSLRQWTLILAALAQYGPAQAQGDYTQVIRDLQKLASATSRVTLVGSPVLENALSFRISGVRTARPFDEWRPRGTTVIEPLTLPVVALMMVDRSKLSDAKTTLGVDLDFSGRWRRDRPWWDKLPPGTFTPGFWYDRGTSFRSPSKAGGLSWKRFLPWAWVDQTDPRFSSPVRSAAHYRLTVRKRAPKPFRFWIPDSPTELATLTHPFNQALVVCGTGDAPLSFFLAGIPLSGLRLADANVLDRVSVETQSRDFLGSGQTLPSLSAARFAACTEQDGVDAYLVMLRGDILRDLSKAGGVQAVDRVKKSDGSPVDGQSSTRKTSVALTAVNAAGPAFGRVDVSLAFDVMYPAMSEEQRSLMLGQEACPGTCKPKNP